MRRGGWRLLPVALGLVLGLAGRAQADPALALEEGLFRLGMRGEREAALALFEAAAADPAAPPAVVVEALYHALALELEEGRETAARALFDRLCERAGEDSPWRARAVGIVPRRFVVASLPWRPGERALYRWVAADGRTTGHAMVRLDALADGRWVLRTVSLAERYEYAWMEYDEGLTRLHRAGFRRREGEGFEPLGALPADYPRDLESVGQLLRRFTPRPGETLQAELYRPSLGGVVAAAIEWRAIEFGETGGEGVVEVEVRTGGQSFGLWLRQEASHGLVRHRTGGIEGVLAEQWQAGPSGHRVVALGPGLEGELPDDWALAPADAPAGRWVILTTEGEASLWLEVDADGAPLAWPVAVADGDPRLFGEGETPGRGTITEGTYRGSEGDARAILRAELFVAGGRRVTATAAGRPPAVAAVRPRFEALLRSLRAGEGRP